MATDSPAKSAGQAAAVKNTTVVPFKPKESFLVLKESLAEVII